MSYVLDWSEAALNTAAGFLADDPVGLDALLHALDGLTEQPRPDTSTTLGNSDLRRLRVGRYRTLYEITDPATISIIHIGRIG